ncbi:receptor-like protein 7 [Cynara cardunculus var. scolymus]|uniref:receptor-like protein 7 n=1 Tax=Cynara cardunculus var. scolymus TaxID=59895 RepID=UPI000D62E133|nr:receptor-like protein 7 [Cynara cardunculus var. scolymus]
MAAYFQHFTFLLKIVLFTLLLVTCTRSSLTHDQECLALYLFKQSFPHASEFQTFDSWKITSNTSNDGSDCCLWDGVVCNNEEDVIALELSERHLRGHINSSSSLFNLVHLQTLNLAINDFTGSQIPSQISRLKQLRTLNLSRSGFNGQVPTGISQLIHLSSLDLSGNPLQLRSPSLEKLVQNLNGLEELDLSGVDISSSVPHFMANFSSLSSIVLFNCSLQDEFPWAVLQLPKLKFLDVASNPSLSGSFPEFLNNSLLEHLDVLDTSFFGIVPESISNLHHLTFLRLTSCFFSGNIPGSLSNMTQLSYLSLSYNEFVGQVPSLLRLSELNHLELSGIQFEKRRMPDWLGKLTKLNNLYLNRMNLDEIPPFLSNLTKLSLVMMEDNSIHGSIPSSFMNPVADAEIFFKRGESSRAETGEWRAHTVTQKKKNRLAVAASQPLLAVGSRLSASVGPLLAVRHRPQRRQRHWKSGSG